MYTPHDRAVESALILASLVWAGMVIGVSFLATPAKFAAPSLTLPVALDVGRHTFGVFAPVEIGAAVIVTILGTLCGGRAVLASIALVDGIAVLQTVWLLPALDARVEVILTGGTVPGSPLHDIYIALEGAKLLALLTVGAGLLFQRRPRGLLRAGAAAQNQAPHSDAKAAAEGWVCKADP